MRWWFTRTFSRLENTVYKEKMIWTCSVWRKENFTAIHNYLIVPGERRWRQTLKTCKKTEKRDNSRKSD